MAQTLATTFLKSDRPLSITDKRVSVMLIFLIKTSRNQLTVIIILAVKLKINKQDRMIFGDFSINFETIALKICKRPFSIKILTVVKNSPNHI